MRVRKGFELTISRRHRWRSVATLSVTLACLASAAPAAAQSGGPAALRAARKAAQAALSAFDRGAAAGRSTSELAKKVQRASRTLSQHSDDLTAADRALIRHLSTLRKATAAIGDARLTADFQRALLSSRSTEIVAEATIQRRWTERFLKDFEAVTADMAKDIACASAFDFLVPADTVHAAWPAAHLSPEKLANQGLSKLATRWQPGSFKPFIAKEIWLKGILSLGQEVARNRPAGVVKLNGHSHLRALYYYARVCHAPPAFTVL